MLATKEIAFNTLFPVSEIPKKKLKAAIDAVYRLPAIPADIRYEDRAIKLVYLSTISDDDVIAGFFLLGENLSEYAD